MEGRKTKAIRNIVFGVVGQFITMALSFISRSIFLYCFTKEYVGVSSLFSGVFSFLTLADLGMEASMTVRLYKPLAEKNWPTIKAYLNYYKKIFNVIAFTIFGAGMALLPFLNLIVDIPENVDNVTLIYFLTLLNTSVTYLFIYKKILFVADQKKYITDITQYCVTFAEYVVLMPTLLITKSYILYLALQCIFKIVYNFAIMLRAKKAYKEVDASEAAVFGDEIKHGISSDMGAISLHRLGDVVSAHSWTILVSSCVSVVTAGLYSNYQLIIGYVKVMLDKFFYAISPSVGNLIATEKNDVVQNMFDKMLFMSFVMTCFCSCCLTCLLNPFIELWIGTSYQLAYCVVIIAVINFYLTNMRKPVLIFKEAYGFFKNDRFRPLIESAISVTASLILCLAFKMELVGVLLGTVVAYMTTTFWIEPYILYRHGFKSSCRIYFVKYIKYTLFTSAMITVAVLATHFFSHTVMGFIVSMVTSAAIPVVGIYVIYRRTDEFKWFSYNLYRCAVSVIHRVKV